MAWSEIRIDIANILKYIISDFFFLHLVCLLCPMRFFAQSRHTYVRSPVSFTYRLMHNTWKHILNILQWAGCQTKLRCPVITRQGTCSMYKRSYNLNWITLKSVFVCCLVSSNHYVLSSISINSKTSETVALKNLTCSRCWHLLVTARGSFISPRQ
jgi:hypothetical protein